MRLRCRPVLAVLFLASALAGPVATVHAQKSGADAAATPSAEVKAVTRAILEEIDKNSELMANLEYLCDMIGPRLTGSDNLTRASAWTQEKFRSYGLENVALEPWTIPHSWSRGTAFGRVVEPASQRLYLESAGWAPSTKGPTRGPVVHLNFEDLDDLSNYQGKLKGAWVVLFPPSVQPSPKQPKPQPNPMRALRNAKGLREYLRLFRTLDEFLASEGVAGVLRDSNKEHALIDMTGATLDYSIGKVPSAFLSNESYCLLWRLMKRGPVQVEIDIKNGVGDEVTVYNTVAEIRGAEQPDEVVIIGGHIDSWDLGTGATDNGTGITAVMEAARALKAVGVKPRRTIRFVLWSGEEQGLHGSRAYVKAHKDQMDKISAVLVHDMGTGRVKSIGLQGRYDLREAMDGVVSPFKEAVGLDELSLRDMGGTDHLSFLPHGVPAFAVVQDEAEYRKTHHTASDTFEKVYPDEANQGAKVLAAWAYNVAMLPDVLPRDPKPAEPNPFDDPQQDPKGSEPKATIGRGD